MIHAIVITYNGHRLPQRAAMELKEVLANHHLVHNGASLQISVFDTDGMAKVLASSEMGTSDKNDAVSASLTYIGELFKDHLRNDIDATSLTCLIVKRIVEGDDRLKNAVGIVHEYISFPNELLQKYMFKEQHIKAIKQVYTSLCA